MPLPLTVHPFVSFLGTEEGINNVMLPEVYSPADSINVWVDKAGRIRKIPGWENLNSTRIVTNSGSQETLVVELFCYIPLGSTYTSQEILAVVVGQSTGVTELWKSTDNGATFSFLSSLTTSGNISVDMAQYRSTLFITQPGAAVRKYAGSSVASAGLTQSPTPSATGSNTGINLSGTYRWKLVSMIGDVRQQGSASSTATQLNAEAASLTWTADADTNVTGYELYRTTGTGGVFYFVTAIDGRTTAAYTDNTADRVVLANRALAEHGDAPPSGAYFVEMHKERAFFGRTSTFPTRGWFSDPGRPESVGATSYFECNDVDGKSSPLTGMTGGYEGKIVYWTAEGIWTVSGTGATIDGVLDLYVRKSSASIGTPSHMTVVRLPEGAIYRDATGTPQRTSKPTLAFMTRLGDFRIFDGTTDTVVSASALAPVSLGAASWAALARATHDPQRRMIRWNYGTDLANCVVWNYAVGTWHHWNQYGGIGTCVIQTAASQQVILVGSGSTASTGGGRVRQVFTGETDYTGATFSARWASNTFYGRFGEDAEGREGPLPAPHLTKRWRWAQVIMGAGPDVEVVVKAMRGNQAASETPFVTKTLDLTASPNRRSMHDKTQLKESTGRFMHDVGIRLVVEDAAVPNDPWVLEAITLAYNVLGGTKRDRGL